MTTSTMTRFDEQVPEFLRVMEVALRSGYSLRQALEMVAEDMSDPMASEAGAVAAEVAGGMPLPKALEAWRGRNPSRHLDLVVAVMGVQFEVGGNLADKLSLIGQVIPRLRG